MSETATTIYSNKVSILADFWLGYRDVDTLADFVEYNDLGLPLAYAIANKIVLSTELSEKFIEETFDILLASLSLEDTGFESIEQIFELAESGIESRK